jgi:hypothetical protein
MVQILEDQPSFGQLMARGAGNAMGSALAGGVQGYLQKKKEEREGGQFESQFGFKMPKEGRSEFYKSYGKAAGEQPFKKQADSKKAYESMKETISELKQMAENDVEGIGVFGEWDPRPEAQHNRGKFQTLSSDLLSFYKTLFPRGITQEEFKRLEKNYIPKVGDSTSKMQGKLEGFMDLIERKLKEQGIEDQKINNPSKQEQTKKRPPLESFRE